MSHGQTDQQQIERTRNTARFFTESRHIAWVLLVANMLWGVYGYTRMPQRKDPDIPIRQALVLVQWPGASAERIEQLVTRRVEEKIAENVRVEKIESDTRTGLTAVFITLVEGVADTGKEFDDIKLKLDTLQDLPDGAGPIAFVKDFGDTAALMLTVASPKADDAQISVMADALERAIAGVRANATTAGGRRVTVVNTLPASVSPNTVRRHADAFIASAQSAGVLSDARPIEGPGFLAIDASTGRSNSEIEQFVQQFLTERLRLSEFHPDSGRPIIIGDRHQARAALLAAAGNKYSYRELDDYTDLIARTLRGLKVVSKVTRTGLLDERVFLEYSQARLASYGINASQLREVLAARNISNRGGVMEMASRQVSVDPSGEFRNEKDLETVLVPTRQGPPVYLRDLADVSRAYVSPPTFLNYYGSRQPDGTWDKNRSITLAVQMRSGAQIEEFGRVVDESLAALAPLLPADLQLARTSDQPRQVEENIDLFMDSLYEAVALVVLVSLIGFWEWRSALLMALSIPITLAMTFGMLAMLNIDLQQVSIASLIIALGLLVDDPVVAGDAIKRDLALGHPPGVAAWLGPTKLATAILFATITNIVAYVPYMLLPGDTGTFLYSLPVVIGCSLVASRVVSMTFIPLLGYYLLRPKAEPPIEQLRQRGFAAIYYRFGTLAIRHRWAFLVLSWSLIGGGAMLGAQLKTQFFPTDLQYLSYVNVWLPEDASLASTAATTEQVEAIIRRVADEHGATHGGEHGQARPVLRSLTTFIGGGGPRFWFSVAPEQSQLNYAQVVIEVFDKHDTIALTTALQAALGEEVAGARVDVRLLETGPPVGIPVAVRIAGDDITVLRGLASDAAAILRALPVARGIRDNWGPDSLSVQLGTNTDRASLASITNRDVAAASATALGGMAVATLREGDSQIPVVARLRMEERAALSDLRNLYVYSSSGPQKLPLEAIASFDYRMQTEKLQRRNQFRTITVSAFPATGYLPSDVLSAAMPQFDRLKATLPPGYRLEIGGEYEEQVKGFANLAIVMALSVAMIFLALVIQFRHAVKPFIVFAAIPYGVSGALATLWLMGSPFGFMAFLGIASLVGVIVSHIIVLFDFIEEMHEQGKPLEQALLDAGIARLRPVLITVAATVIALFPLAAHGGPLWEPMCYAQIGGLIVATFVTLVVVPVLYAICVRDLKIVSWHEAGPPAHQAQQA